MADHSPRPTLIRSGKAKDLPRLIALEDKCFTGDLISPRSFRSFMKNRSSHLLVAEDDTESLLGYAVVLFRKGSATARLYSLAVDPDAEGKGVGSQLLGGIEAVAKNLDCTTISLEVRKDNQRAADLYIRHGYAFQCDLPGYYEDGTDGQRLTRDLGQIPQGAKPANRNRLPIILVDRLEDLDPPPQGARVMTVREYLALEHGIPGRRIINLARSYEPMSLGYYCSLLANARKERCLPEVDALLDINWKRIHKRAQLTLQSMLDKLAGDELPEHIDIHFGRTKDKRFREMARQAFDLFRCPALRINLRPGAGAGATPRIRDIEAVAVHRLDTAARSHFNAALKAFIKGSLPKPATRKFPSAIIAILVNPDEESPPSDDKALEAFVAAAESMDARAELITAKDYSRLLEFDALFIRETTALNHHTYRFATRAREEGMPVIDDPQSIVCCTNKIYLAELLKSHRVRTPRTVVFDRHRLKELAPDLDFPGIVKVPDGCFSRGVHKVDNLEELMTLSRDLFRKSDLLMMQEYTPTDFDWRIGVLDGEPLFACKYYMVSGNWKIYEYETDGSVSSGDSETVAIDDVPEEVIDVALRGTRLIGNGFYGVDIKETPLGPSIIEINDNPNVDSGIEDDVLGKALYERIMAVLMNRIGRASN